MPILRRSLLEIGARLAQAHVLTDRADVFHLRLEELEDIGDPATLGKPHRRRLRAAVRDRRARRAALAGVRLIDPAVIHPGRPSGDALVAGVPASGGLATGPVRVIRTPGDFAALRDGDVLVCPYTNPAWTPLFLRAAAVVADAGGAASHAAIVAREYGIPAVMGAAVATTVLVEGQTVTVDGYRGYVTPGGRTGGRAQHCAAGAVAG